MTIGIYKITNQITTKFYIGASQDVEKRMKNHKRALMIGRHSCKEMQNDYSAISGETYYMFDVIEECTQKELAKKEQYWIRELKAVEWGYNTVIPTLEEENKKMKRIISSVTEEAYSKLEKLSLKEDRSINNLVTRIITKYLNQVR